MQNSQINFTPTIRLVTAGEFLGASKRVPNRVNLNGISKAGSAYTTGICDCTAGGITDGIDVVMFHIEPDEESLKGLPGILSALRQKIDLKSKRIHGFLWGSYDYDRSNKIFTGLETFMGENAIPCTKFKQHREKFAASDILYNSSKDEWLVTSDQISDEIRNRRKLFGKMSIEEIAKQAIEIVKKSVKQFEIAPGDKLVVSSYSGFRMEITDFALKYLFAAF